MTKCEGVLSNTPNPFSQTLSHEDETRFANQCGNDPEGDQIYSVCNALALAVLTQGTLSATNARRLVKDCLPPTLVTLALSLSKPQTHPSLQGSLQQIIIIEKYAVIRKGLHITSLILAPVSSAAQQVVSTGHPIIHKINTADEEQEQGGEGEEPHASPIITTSYADWNDLLKPYSKGKVSHIITLPVHQPSGNRPMGAISALLSHNEGGPGVKQDVVRIYKFSECLGRCLAHQMKCVWESSFSMMAKVLPPQIMTRMVNAAMACPSAAAAAAAATGNGEGKEEEEEEKGCKKTGEAVVESEGAEEGKGVPPPSPSPSPLSLSLLLKRKAAPNSAAAALAFVDEEEKGGGNPFSLSPKSMTRLNSQTFISTATSSRGSSELPCSPPTPMHGSCPVVSATQMNSITGTTRGHNHHQEEEEAGGGSGGDHQYDKKKQSELFENKEEEDNCSYASPLTSLISSSSKKNHQEEEPPSLKTMDLTLNDGQMEQEYHRHFNTKNTSRDKMLLSQYACIAAADFLFTMLNFAPVCTFGLNQGSCLEDRVGIVGASTLVIVQLYQLAQAAGCTLAPLALLHVKREWYVANRTAVLGASRIFRLALIVVVWSISQMLLPSLLTATTATQITVMNNLLAHMTRCSCCIIMLGAFKYRIPFRSHIVVMMIEWYISLLMTALVFTNIDTAASHAVHQDQFYRVVGHQCAAAAVSSMVVYLAERQDRRSFFFKKKEEESYSGAIAS